MSAPFELQPPAAASGPGETVGAMLVRELVKELRRLLWWVIPVASLLTGGAAAGVWNMAQRFQLHEQAHSAQRVTDRRVAVLVKNVGHLCTKNGVRCDGDPATEPQDAPDAVVPTSMRE